MSDAKKRVVVTLHADARDFQKKMDLLARDMTKVGKQLQTAGRSMTMAITAPFAALGAMSVQSFDKQAKAIAQIDAGLKSTGNAAGFTSDQLQKIASDLQKKTLFGDEEILQKATAQLLTFTTIAGQQFERAQVAAMNLATRLDGDLQSAAIMVGKALNDPIKGLTAMGRAGVQFTQEQKNVIKALWEAGQQAEAQRLILNELEKQYGGSAEAAAKAGLGGFTQMKNALDDLGEEFGKIIVEGINPLVARVQNLVSRFQSFDDQKKKNIVRFAAMAAAVGPVMWIFGGLVVQVGKLIKLFGAFRMLSMSLVKGVNLTTAGVTTQVFGVKALSAAWTKLSLAMKTNVIILTISALIAGIALLSKAFQKKNEIQKEFQAIEEGNVEAMAEEVRAGDALFKSLAKSNAGSAERNILIKKANEQYGVTIKNYNTESEWLSELEQKHKDVNAQIRSKIALQIYDQQGAALARREIQSRALLMEAFMKTARRNIKAEQDLFSAAGDNKGLEAYMNKIMKAADNENSLYRYGKEHWATIKEIWAEQDSLNQKIDQTIALTKNLGKVVEDTGNGVKGKSSKTKDWIVTVLDDAKELDDALDFEVKIDTTSSDAAIKQFMETIPPVIQKFNDWQDAIKGLNNMLESMAEDAIVTLAESVGKMLGGGDIAQTFDDFIIQLADFGKQLGQYLIAYGISIEAFKTSTKTLQGIPAIIAGTALVATAGLIKQLIANKADKFALGTNFAPGGMALVGERGPELVHLPRGSKVTPNMQTQGMLATGNLFVTLKGSDIQIALDRNAKRQRRYA